jgi:hypothetical protein
VPRRTTPVSEIDDLAGINYRFIEAFRRGSWELLEPILAPEFSYLDGATGETWSMDRYVGTLDGRPRPTIDFDQLRIHVVGDLAVVSARTFTGPGLFNRYIDTYQRRRGRWRCVHACVWPLAT